VSSDETAAQRGTLDDLACRYAPYALEVEPAAAGTELVVKAGRYGEDRFRVMEDGKAHLTHRGGRRRR
jgi:hypothetical protein